MIKIESVTKTFRSLRNVVRALTGVSLEVKPGEIVALLGRNGSGKTTTIRTVCGLVIPDEGSVSINGLRFGQPNYMAQLGALIDTNRVLFPRYRPSKT